jgi:hypothetical protein
VTPYLANVRQQHVFGYGNCTLTALSGRRKPVSAVLCILKWRDARIMLVVKTSACFQYISDLRTGETWKHDL